MNALRTAMDLLLFLSIFLINSILFAQDIEPCEKHTNTLTGIQITKNPEIKARLVNEETLAFNLHEIMKVKDKDMDDNKRFDKTFVIGFLVILEGNITGERLIKASGNKRLDSLYLNAFTNSKWRSAYCEDKPVTSWVEFQYMIYK